MSFNHSPKIVTDGLVLCLDAKDLKSYSGSGTTWVDRSGNGNNGTLVNGVGHSDGAMVFDGVNDYVDCGPVSVIGSSLSGLTVDVWINTSVKATKCIVENGTSYTTNTFYVFQENSDYFTFEVYGSFYDAVYANFIYNINTWYNIVGVWASNTRVDMYVNGKLSSGTRGGLAQSNLINGNTNFLLGSRNASSFMFSGKYGGIKAYNRALSPAEILQNYNATKSRFNLL
jgi:hypothetical protein